MPTDRLQLDYVSPLPPTRTGIADYSVDLLTAWQRLGLVGDPTNGDDAAAVRCVAVEGQEVDDELRERFCVVDWEHLGASDRVPLYQVGNNLFHEQIVLKALERPGIVTLHDVYLHHLLIERTLGRTDLEAYVSGLRRDHGWVGERVAIPPRWGVYAQAGMFALPAHRNLLEAQRGVLVHSEWAARKIEDEGVRVASRVVSMPMPTPALEGPERAHQLRERWGVPQAARLLGSFGFQTPIKRTASAMRALAHPELDGAHLVIAGRQSPGLDLEGLAADLGVAERVHCLGYLPAGDFSAAIRACDLCVNLRFPTAGETSASLLRILALGRATLVSDYAQFRDLPEEFCIRIPLGEDPADESVDSREVRAIARACGDLFSAPDKLASKGERARAYVASAHDPQRCAQQILEACRELTEVSPSAAFTQAADHHVPLPTSATWGELQCRIEVDGLAEWHPGRLGELEVRVYNDSSCRWLPASAGPGGVMLEVALRDAYDADWSPREWPPLREELPPGAVWTTRLQLRRPLVGGHLWIEPHLAGGRGFSQHRGERLHIDLHELAEDQGRESAQSQAAEG